MSPLTSWAQNAVRVRSSVQPTHQHCRAGAQKQAEGEELAPLSMCRPEVLSSPRALSLRLLPRGHRSARGAKSTQGGAIPPRHPVSSSSSTSSLWCPSSARRDSPSCHTLVTRASSPGSREGLGGSRHRASRCSLCQLLQAPLRHFRHHLCRVAGAPEAPNRIFTQARSGA
ncbi:hypothetical protein NDU88_002693 [Pleurodeles waltl]|uniref:Uncharacterized protein n=1 Tax=Pleurodeles waltl TaxID=8319 RepID=A0AAV7UAF1_PLEWA|nr:hypothetical protein NDU88_002693 [Pleurodeles waltl]